MRYLVLAVLLLMQAGPVKEYVPTEIQMLRLQNAQKDCLLAYDRVKEAQAEYQKDLSLLNLAADTVKQENHWDQMTQFDPATLKFSEAKAPKGPTK